MKRKDLDEFVKCYNGENLPASKKSAQASRHTRKLTWTEKKPDGRWRAFEYDELINRDKTGASLPLTLDPRLIWLGKLKWSCID